MESSFQTSFTDYWTKIEKYSNRVNIDQSAMYYLSMKSTL